MKEIKIIVGEPTLFNKEEIENLDFSKYKVITINSNITKNGNFLEFKYNAKNDEITLFNKLINQGTISIIINNEYISNVNFVFNNQDQTDPTEGVIFYFPFRLI